MNASSNSLRVWITALVSLATASIPTAADVLYWTEWTDTTHGGAIQRANSNGTGVELIIPTTSGIRGITIDLRAMKIYWADTGLDRIMRANVDGSSAETVISEWVLFPFAIALDNDGKLYWADQTLRQIGRCSVDVDCGRPEILIDDGIAKRGLSL